MFRTRHACWSAALLAVVCSMSIVTPIGSIAHGQQAAPTYEVGQAIEVREGDEWSAAKVVAREGRRYQIQYADGTTEWTTVDRIRLVGTKTPPGSAKGKTEAEFDGEVTPPAPVSIGESGGATTKPTIRSFPAGTIVEVKNEDKWVKARINNRRGDWHLVGYANERGTEWVEPWRIRTLNDSTYDINSVRPNRRMIGNVSDPPTEKPRVRPAQVDRRGKPFEHAAVGWPIIDVSLDGVPEVFPSLSSWSYVAAPSTDIKALDKAMPLKGGITNDRSEHTSVLEIAGNVAMLSYVYPNSGKDAFVELVDIPTSRTLYRGQLDPESIATSVSPNGKVIGARSKGTQQGTRTRVDIWETPAAAAPPVMPGRKPLVSFSPYLNSGDSETDAAQVVMLDAAHVLTINSGDHVICWKVAAGSAQALWHGKFGTTFVLSPDHKAIATLWKGAVLLVDTSTGVVVGSIPTPAARLTGLTFRGDGKRLLGLDGPTLYLFDLEAGKQLASIGLPPLIRDGTRVFSSGDDVRHLMGDAVWFEKDSTVIDTAKLSLVGTYKSPEAERGMVFGDRYVASLEVDGRRSLCSWIIPQGIPKGVPPLTALALAPAPLPIIDTRPGLEVAIDVSLDADEAFRTKVTQLIQRQVKTRLWNESPNAKVRIVAKTESGKSEAAMYGDGILGGIMGIRNGTPVTVTEKVTRLTVEMDGKPAWEVKTITRPSSSVRQNEGQSVQDAVNASHSYDTAFLLTTILPDVLFQPMEVLPPAPTFTLLPGGVKPG